MRRIPLALLLLLGSACRPAAGEGSPVVVFDSDLPRLSTNAVQILAKKSGHFIQWDAPTLVSAAVTEVVDASRAHRRLRAAGLAPVPGESEVVFLSPAP